jgi:hypothetical protein
MSATAAASLVERNAANAQHSTGPVTAEGKARASQNSLRHGLTARTVVLPHESQAEYDDLKIAFMEEYQPGTGLEHELLARMVDCWWRLNRALRVESEFYDQRAKAICDSSPDLSGDSALAMMFVDPAESRSFRLFMRYLTNAQNSWHQARAEYQQTRKARLQRDLEASMFEAMMEARRNAYASDDEEETEIEEEEIQPEPEPEAHQPSAYQPESGFVSHRSVVPDEPRPCPGLPRNRNSSEKAA